MTRGYWRKLVASLTPTGSEGLSKALYIDGGLCAFCVSGVLEIKARENGIKNNKAHCLVTHPIA